MSQRDFPSPADDYIDQWLDLNDHLIDHPAATFFIRMPDDSMIGEHFHRGDLLVVDRSLRPTDGFIPTKVPKVPEDG